MRMDYVGANAALLFNGSGVLSQSGAASPQDIDLVQTQSEVIGTTVDAIRDALSWLGKPKKKRTFPKIACADNWDGWRSVG